MGRQHFAKGRELAGIDACRAPHAHHCETSMFWMRNRTFVSNVHRPRMKRLANHEHSGSYDARFEFRTIDPSMDHDGVCVCCYWLRR